MRFRILIALVAALATREAQAFDDASQFFAQSANPHAATYGASAEGVYFTGAPRFSSMTCQTCHTGGPGQVRLKLGADPATLFTDGYQPGATYELEVELLGEVAGLDHGGASCTEPPALRDKYTYVQCNNNAFALEVDALDGPLQGAQIFCAAPPSAGLCPAPNPHADEALVAPDGDAVFANRAHDPAMPKLVVRNDPTTWHLWWTAPAAGRGPVTIHVAVVDGNGGAGTAVSDQDTLGDDTVQSSFFIPEAGAPPPTGATAGCATSGHGPSAPLGIALVVVALGAAWAFARKRLWPSRR